MGGVVLDASVIVRLERQGATARETIAAIGPSLSGRTPYFSPVVVTELLHGIYRAHDSDRRGQRREYLDNLLAQIPVLVYGRATAEIAGKLSGEAVRAGGTLPQMDLMIAASALEHSHALLTANLRDFARIPELQVIHFAR